MCAGERVQSTQHLKMVKEEKRHFSVSSGGKWFAHADVSESEARRRETCTTTGRMLSPVGTSPHGWSLERYPKGKTHQKSREFPHSHHDNKHALKDNITIFSDGVGLRKCPDNLRQSNSHFCLHDSGAETRDNSSIYKTDFMSAEVIDAPKRSRRFPQNHKLRSAEAAKAQAGEQFMWFGQRNVHPPDSLEMLAAARRSAPSKI